MRLLVTLAVCIFLVLIGGCTRDQGGRYDRYQYGGSYTGCHPRLADNCRILLYSSPNSGRGDLQILNLETQQITNLTNSAEYEGDASYSNFGGRIVFVRELNSRGSIWTMNSDGTDQRQHSFDADYNHSPTFLSAHEVVYCKQGGRFGDTRDQLWIVDIRSNESRSLAAAYIEGSSPDASKDRQIAFSRFTSDRSEVFIWDVDRQSELSLGFGSSPAFSPDGNSVVCVLSKHDDFEYDLCTIDIKSGTRTWITNDGGYKSSPSWPADNWIVYADSSGTPEPRKIIRITLDTNSSEVLYDFESH